MSLADKKIFITGGSRGIGLAIALRAAKDGASIAIAAKSVEENPKLGGTIYSAAKEIEAAGGKALPIQCDIRDEDAITAAVAKAAQEFGGLDILINNASAINLTPTEKTPAKRFDLMFDVNVRGTFLTSQAVIPYLKQSAESGRNPHILTLSPPLSMKPKWFKNHVAYTMSKYGMSMCVLGMAEEFKRDAIGVNALWSLKDWKRMIIYQLSFGFLLVVCPLIGFFNSEDKLIGLTIGVLIAHFINLISGITITYFATHDTNSNTQLTEI